mgnify:FL=1
MRWHTKIAILLVATFSLSGCYWMYCEDEEVGNCGTQSEWCDPFGPCYSGDDCGNEPITCQGDEDCLPGEFCNDGVCWMSEYCVEDWECPIDWHCDQNEGICLPDEMGCTQDSDCESGEYCEEDNGECIETGT